MDGRIDEMDHLTTMPDLPLEDILEKIVLHLGDLDIVRRSELMSVHSSFWK